MYLPSNVDSLV